MTGVQDFPKKLDDAVERPKIMAMLNGNHMEVIARKCTWSKEKKIKAQRTVTLIGPRAESHERRPTEGPS